LDEHRLVDGVTGEVIGMPTLAERAVA
jgi:hypothetical protein